MTNPVYEASVYQREVSYRNFKGVEKTTTLYFALDPLKLMEIIARIELKPSKSGNPALKNQAPELTESEKLKFVRELAIESAGWSSEDGENWTKSEDFEVSLAGKAFLAKLTASDGDRREFTEKVILDPFRAFSNFAISDPSNSPKDVAEFKRLIAEAEKTFATPEKEPESIEERRSRLAAEMAALGEDVGNE